MNAEKMVEFQHQMRQNQSDLQNYLRELDDWESDIKIKENSLKNPQSSEKEKLPPVRNSLDKKKKKKKPKENGGAEKRKAERISGYDFKSWDKFDVEKECAKIDTEKSSGSEYETDEEWEEQRKKQQAIMFKDQGNQYFKEKKYDEAIECYTSGMAADPDNALLYANRAMALLKQDKWAAAEADCTRAIALDPTYVKAYSRRGTARMYLNKLEDTAADFNTVLALEPGNKQAQHEIKRIANLLVQPAKAKGLEVEGQAGIIKPIFKPASQRSTKPLRKIPIEEIGEDPELAKQRQAVEEIKSTQSETKHKITQQDEELFNKITEIPDTKDSSSDVSKPDTQIDVKSEASKSSSKEKSRKDKSKKKKPAAKKEPAAQEEVVSPSSSPRIPDVPTTSFQFQTDYKSLCRHPEKFYQYFKAIQPCNYVKLFGEALDADILLMVLRTMQDYYIPADHDVMTTLASLSEVKRFDMTVLFMSSADKAIVHRLFDHVISQSRHSEAEVSALQKKYQI